MINTNNNESHNDNSRILFTSSFYRAHGGAHGMAFIFGSEGKALMITGLNLFIMIIVFFCFCFLFRVYSPRLRSRYGEKVFFGGYVVLWIVGGLLLYCGRTRLHAFLAVCVVEFYSFLGAGVLITGEGGEMVGTRMMPTDSGGSGSESWRKYLDLSSSEDSIGDGSNPPAQEEVAPAQAGAAQEAALPGTPAGEPEQPPQSPPHENSYCALEARHSLLMGQLHEIEREISSLQRGEDPSAHHGKMAILQEHKLFLEGELEVNQYRELLRTMIWRKRLEELGYKIPDNELDFLLNEWNESNNENERDQGELR